MAPPRSEKENKMAGKTFILRKPDLASGQIFVGDAAGMAQPVAMSGDATISATGVITVGAGAGVTLDPAQMAVGSSGSVATARDITGDIAISATGVVSITGGSIINADVNTSAAIVGSKLAANARKNTAKSVNFDLDIGSGSTADDVIIVPKTAITITEARVVPTKATIGASGSAGNVRIGTSVGGSQISGSAGLVEGAVGVEQILALASGAVTAGSPVIVRHTGVAATVAGEYFVEIDFSYDD